MSGVSGAALWEASCINRSLSALSDVLGALAEQRPHIPYRNSKLTHLLQDVIGDTHTHAHTHTQTLSLFLWLTDDSFHTTPSSWNSTFQYSCMFTQTESLQRFTWNVLWNISPLIGDNLRKIKSLPSSQFLLSSILLHQVATPSSCWCCACLPRSASSASPCSRWA